MGLGKTVPWTLCLALPDLVPGEWLRDTSSDGPLCPSAQGGSGYVTDYSLLWAQVDY